MEYKSYFAKQLTSRKNKPWLAVLKYKDANGKWKETSKMLPETVKGKREANKLAEAWFNEMNQALANSPNIEIEKTVGDAVEEYIAYQFRLGRLEDSTRKAQMSNFRNYVEPYIGDYSFITFDRTGVKLWLEKLYNKGLGQGTISNAYHLVKKVYDYHYDLEELTRNPFNGVKAPKTPPPKITHLTAEQMDNYLSAVYAEYNPEDKFYIGALLLFYAGLRRQEVCGLRWKDIDFKNNTLSVESAIGMGEKTYTKQPKTPTSKRSFPMVPQLAYALKERYNAIKPLPSWFVCGEGDKYWNPQSFSNYFRAFVKRNDLRDAYDNLISPHMLRHNLGAVGINSNMDIASLSKMMGHASRAMTLDTYGDATKDAMILATGKLGENFDKNTEFFKRVDIEPDYIEPEEEKPLDETVK